MSILEEIIEIPVEHEQNVCGQFDAYLKKIERTLHVTMIARDGEIKIIGPEKAVSQARSVFNNLIQLSMRQNAITEQNVDYALSLSFTEEDGQILEIDKDIICRYTLQGKPVKPKDAWTEALRGCHTQKDDRLWNRPGGNGKDVSCDGYGDHRPLKTDEVGRIILDTSGD